MSFWAMLRGEIRAGIDLLLPPACHFCGGLLASPTDSIALCTACRQALPHLEASCRRCARPFASLTPTSHLCEPCLRTPPPFTRVYAVGRHAGLLQENIHRFKYRNQLILARTFARLLGRELEAAAFRPDLVLAVPLHPGRLRRRGYNQALELARPLAKLLDTPLEIDRLQRRRRTPPQQGLTLAERKANLKDAFVCTAPVSAKRVLLVDDVMTSGATVSACCSWTR